MDTIRLFIENIVYYNEDNYYAVLDVSEGDDLFNATGYLPYISAGETIEAEGEYRIHPVYGRQFAISSYQVIRPDSADMIRRYLAGGAVKGIGPALAVRIVEKFGDDTFRIMEEEPERLSEVRGISKNTAMLISQEIERKKGYRDAVMYLESFGIGPNLAGRIYECYGPAVYSVMEKNPYRLADDVDGVGFKLADTIAVRSGIPSDSEFRIKCGIVYTLQEAIGQGHTWLPEEMLLHFTSELLGLDRELIREKLLEMHMEGRLVVLDPAIRRGLPDDSTVIPDDSTVQCPKICSTETQKSAVKNDGLQEALEAGASESGASGWRERDADQEQDANRERQVYLASCYYVEKNIALRLKNLDVQGESDADFVEKRIRQVYSETKMEPDAMQEEAIRESVGNGVLIITGGPGTGKTTTINNIIRYYGKDHRTVLLAAPTGRAAKRMSEATGCEAKTIHRLLEYTGRPEEEEGKKKLSSYDMSDFSEEKSGGRGKFLKNEKEPLECDVLIVDEVSMVDVFLMDALLRALRRGTRLILVGDANQLPSVGAGNVLRDLITSGSFHTVQLSHIFRQAAQSDIVLNAHRINGGETVDLAKKSRDFLFIRVQEPTRIVETIKILLTKKLPDYVEADPLSIQVLTPTRKGALGVEVLNRELQAFLNPAEKGKREKTVGAVTFREGDKVMQVKNNYDLEWTKKDRRGVTSEVGSGIFNGDMGKILRIDPAGAAVTVVFDDGRAAEYSGKELNELELSYAVTVHKSQGSEYPAVVIPMYYGPSMLMNRNLLYTAVTRAKKCVCLVGIPQVFERMAANQTESRRYSGLKDRILELG